MLFLFFSLLGCLAVLQLAGLAAFAPFGIEPPRNPFLTCWFGLFILSLLLIPLSFFMPLNGLTGGALSLALALLGGKQAWKIRRNPAPALSSVRGFVWAASLLVLGISLGTAYMSWQNAFDTGLYHAQIVRWLNEYGMVKGLGNLHFRLANNSSWLDVAALVDNGPWEGRSAWIMSGLLLCLSLLYFLHELFFSGTSWAKIYALCILFAIPFLPGINVPSLYYDYPSIIIHCIVVLEILYIITNKKICHQHFIIIIGLTTLCFMMKSIDPVIIIVVPSFILFTLIKRKEFCFTVAAKIMVLPLIAAVLWIGKNLILSGYPLFPVPALPVWFDWTMTRGDVNACYQAVRGFARTMNAWKGVMPSGVTEWFPFWLQRQMGNNSFRTVMLLPFLMACPLWGWLLARGRTPKILFVFGWQIAGLIGWFAAAPDPRFGYGFVLSFLASGAALAVWERKADLKKIARMGGYILIVLLLIRLGRDLRKAPHSLWGIGAHPPGPAAMRIVEGQGYPFTLRIPLSENKWCDNAELPCAPWEPQNLCLRKPYDLGEGFRPCTR